MQSAEALCRTPVDLLLNERMGRLVKEDAFKEMCLLGEKHMDAKRADKDEWISGDMDYVIGYGGDEFRFDANLAVVEAKRQKSLSGGVAQCIAYLGMRTVTHSPEVHRGSWLTLIPSGSQPETGRTTPPSDGQHRPWHSLGWDGVHLFAPRW